MRLKDQVAIITGASRGIGRAIALRFAQEGANIVGFSRNLQSLERLASEIRNHGVRCLTIAGSVAVTNDVERVISTTADKFGRIDILVNNAGVTRAPESQSRSFLQLTEEDWDGVVGVNLKGAFICTQAAARQMVQRRSGRIINIASVLSYRVNPDASVLYHVSKGALLQLTASVAAALAPHNIIVNGIAPGWIETDLTKDDLVRMRDQILNHMILKRIGQPEDVAEMALFLATETTNYLVGQVVVLDGGQSLLASSYKTDR